MHRTLSLLALLPAIADAGALRDHDSSPLTSTFGLPDATESGSILDAGRTRWSVGLQLTSHSVAERAGSEIFVADGETTRLSLEWRRGTADRWEIGIKLPTGDEDELYGSGDADVSPRLAGQREGIGVHPDWTAFYRLHGVYLGEGRWLTRQ